MHSVDRANHLAQDPAKVAFGDGCAVDLDTFEEKWTTDLRELEKGCLIYADGQLLVLTQLLFIELVAFGTFNWAKTVLSDRECSAAPELAPQMVDYIQQDESIHADRRIASLEHPETEDRHQGNGLLYQA